MSGTGCVAQGVEFDNGKCALTWLSEISSVAVYDKIEDIEKIHGHGGKTQIVFTAVIDDELPRAAKEVWEPERTELDTPIRFLSPLTSPVPEEKDEQERQRLLR